MLHKSSAAVVIHCGVVIFFCLPLEGKVSLATGVVGSPAKGSCHCLPCKGRRFACEPEGLLTEGSQTEN